MNVETQPLPAALPVMRQKWRRLLFLHWSLDPGLVQATLPEGLHVQEWNGAAWVAIVPFAMVGVRPVGVPPLPGISSFLELNVRTYVRDEKGRTGVWFYSLDCTQPLAVWGARRFYGLPYFDAQMIENVGLAQIGYSCRRKGSDRMAVYRYRGVGRPQPSERGSLEEFLYERYDLFSVHGGRLRMASVWHEPYQVQPADVETWSVHPLEQASLDVGMRSPDHAMFAPGVDVTVYGMRD